MSDKTKANKSKYEEGYKPSQSVTDARNRLREIEALKPGPYQSKYAAQLEGILEEITNGDKFKYNFNDDEIFKYYADLYTEKGRQASADTMAQAQAQTGGYGNSYAQSVGNQAYQQYLLNLYDKGLDMQNQAYARYQDEKADRYNQYNTLMSADATDYGRYRDEYGDWQNERTYAYNAEQDEYNRDYNSFITDRNYWDQQAQLENQDYWTNQSNILSNKELEESIRQNDMKIAQSYVAAIMANGQMPSDELLAAAGLSYDDAVKMMTVAEGTPTIIYRNNTENTGNTGDTGEEEDNRLSYYDYSLINNADAAAQAATGAETIEEGLQYLDRQKLNPVNIVNNPEKFIAEFSKKISDDRDINLHKKINR